MPGTTIHASNNARLRQLVGATHLSTAVALTLFNRGLGKRAFGVSSWRAMLAGDGADQSAHLDDDLLAHAKAQFAPWVIDQVEERQRESVDP